MTASGDHGPLAQARTEPAPDGRVTLVLTRELHHPPDAVWAALTDPGRLAGWAPFTADRDLAAPGDATLTMIDGDTRMPLPAAVTQAEPPRVLEYRWGEDLLRWEIEPTAHGARLTLRHTVAAPADGPRAAAGWHLCLDVAERLLDGAPVAPIRGREAMDHGWQALHDAYAQRLVAGPGVSASGPA